MTERDKTMNTAHPHPEWKRLAEEIQPLLETRKAFEYPELSLLAGVDIQSPRGRNQFERFRRYALAEWGLWFECEHKVGYRVTQPSEHPGCSMKRVRRGRRQMKKALAIVVKTREEGAQPETIMAKRQISASLGAILQYSEAQARKIRPLLASVPVKISDAAETLKALDRPPQ